MLVKLDGSQGIAKTVATAQRLVEVASINKSLIKTSGSESRGQEEAACARHQAYATTTVSYYTDESSIFFKCCSSAAVTAIA